MAKFRKKPIIIEAWRIPFADRDMPQCLADDPNIIFKRDRGMIIEAVITTLEGVMTASLNDWIIKGVKGELYPCKPDIFSATYEPSQYDQ